MAATTGDERDGCDRWGNVCGRRSYIIDVRYVEEMVGTTREAGGMATESGGDETGGPGDETGDKTAATAGDERDGGVMFTDKMGVRI